VWVEVKFSFLWNENQQAVGILGVTRDITERKQVEEALRESEEQYRLVVENAKESIIITQDMKLVFANRAAMDLGGYSKEILTSKSFTEFIHSDDLNMVADNHIRRIKGEKIPPVYSFRIIGQDGTVIWCEINATVIQWKGKPATLNFLTNVTERKQVEEALRESEEQYRLVVENARESIIVTQDVDVKVVFANHAAIDMMGYSKEILSSKYFTDLIYPDDLNIVVDHHIKRLKGEEVPAVYSFRVIRQDGTIMWCEINAALIQWKGKPATLLFLNNITERKLAEVKLNQTLESLQKAFGATIQVMVSAVEMKDPYTAGHQLRAANLACAIAKEMGLPQDKIEGLRMAGSIHDIGKLSIPAEILSKPSKLTNLEFLMIKEHAQSGYDILKDVESPWPLAQIVYQHHERMDGSGYPRNLKGDEILMEARIMSVADVVEAMASHRPYRAALGIEVALEEIEKNRGTLYDKDVADACLRLFREKGYKLLS
jgi:PAS domain S-box-containing protein